MKTVIGLAVLFLSQTLSAQTQQPASGGGLAERFKLLDRNGDGKVTRGEGGSLQFFDEADKDKNGLLTLEEAEAYARLNAAPARSRTAGMEGDGAGPMTSRVQPVEIPEAESPILTLDAEAADGRAVRAFWRKPKGEGPFPAVVFIHGGLTQFPEEVLHRQLTINPVVTRMLAAGYAVAQATFRTYEQDVQSRGPIEDVRAVVHALAKTRGIDGQRLALFGGSGGGSIALELGGDPAVRAVIAGEPATVLYTGMLTTDDYATRLDIMAAPENYLTPALRARTLEKLKTLRAPVLILHSDQHALHKLNAPLFVPMMKEAGVKVEYREYRGYGHGFYFGGGDDRWGKGADDKVVTEVMRDVCAFLGESFVEDKLQQTAVVGSKIPRNESATTSLARLAFTQDYFPGTKDTKGQFMGGTEAMWLAGHNGKLFAAIGYGQDQPGTDPKPGAQVLRKDAPDAPWQVDHQFEPTCMRVEGLISFAFTTDLHGKPLPKPARLLVASPSELTRAGGASAVFIRNDATGEWQRSEITGGNLGVRSFGSHVDNVTGVHHLFAGLNRGGIHRGSYDPAIPGGIRWEPTPERTAEALPGKGRRVYDYSRVLSFAECNGDLYMASRITTGEDGQPMDGGLYRRVDGRKPSWELVHRWTIDKDVLQSRFLRGLTPVPDPKGGKHQVLIANFEYPGLIARFDPTKAVVAAEQELDIKEFFNQAWNTPSARRRGAIAAYNRFLPVTDPKSGETVWLCGAWVERPGSPTPPDNGSCYLIRHRDGRYEWGSIYDPAHPVPSGQKLTGCRDIEPSPFAGEQGRVFYFCGYDGGAGPGHNTAWIYKGTMKEKP